ncbi:hypothetical protein OPV22_012008 [Ensete ventricosum]|uniref:Piwi domain-containing protein n=1 Tax=Ensete ventricosum TaxID=4639 RepID=A0AAV8R647_ENSVE|nr:hypothetical protein OPV22_012008 [Ensete ventricosum]
MVLQSNTVVGQIIYQVCKIVKGQIYSEKLNEKRITALLEVSCRHPHDRELDIVETVRWNDYHEDPYAEEFGIKISDKLASVEARVLHAPRLKYHDTGREKMLWSCTSLSKGGSLRIVVPKTESGEWMSNQYLANVALKINVKIGWRHPYPGEDSSPSIAAVVAFQDWPEVTKYVGLVCAQVHRQALIQDLFREWELLVSLEVRIIFYRDGASDGQFDQACPSTEPNYQQPKTSVVVQKRHRTRLFANNHSNRCSVDTIGNILPGTGVVYDLPSYSVRLFFLFFINCVAMLGSE